MMKNNKDEKPSHSTFTYLVLVGRDVKEPAPLFEKSGLPYSQAKKSGYNKF